MDKKCTNCSKEIREVYYEIRERKKTHFGLEKKEKIFCGNCWKKQEKNYQNYPTNSECLVREVIKFELGEKGLEHFLWKGYHVHYDLGKKEWITEKPNFTDPESKGNGHGLNESKNGKLIWVILTVFLVALLFWLFMMRKKKEPKKNFPTKTPKILPKS